MKSFYEYLQYTNIYTRGYIKEYFTSKKKINKNKISQNKIL